MKTREEVRKLLEGICYWSTDALLNEAVEWMLKGKSIVADALPYIGNGRWERSNKRGRYKYKMFAPALDENGNLYSTDLYAGPISFAASAPYGIYRHTRQKVIAIADVCEADISKERLMYGHKTIAPLVVLPDSTKRV